MTRHCIEVFAQNHHELDHNFWARVTGVLDLYQRDYEVVSHTVQYQGYENHYVTVLLRIKD